MAIITISRGTFSGGEELAEHLGKRLGWEVLLVDVRERKPRLLEAPMHD